VTLTRKGFVTGLSAALATDGARLCAGELTPAKTGIVFDVEHFATKDGPGIRTAVFLKGCPLRCIWCQNPESWKYGPEPIADGPKGETRICGKSRSAEDVVEEVLRDRPFYANSGGGLTLSGGEPLAQAAFCGEILRRTHEAGVHTAIETSGYAPFEVIESVEPFVDLWLYDIKQLDAEKFLKYTARPMEPVLANLRHLNAHKRRIVLRLPMIPGLNDDDGELAAIGRLADELDSVEALDVEPYVPYGVDKAQKLGLKVYEASRPPASYGPEIVRRLQARTKKPVRLA